MATDTIDAPAPVDEDALKARRLRDALVRVVDARDPDVAGGFIAGVVGPSPSRPGEMRFPSAVLRQMVELYPGALVKLLQDLEALDDDRLRVVAAALVQRITAERLDPELAARLAALEFNRYDEASFPELGAAWLADMASQLYELVADILSTAKEFYAHEADDLADEGYPVTAAMLATASDLFLPGTPVELALNFVPVGRIAAVTKILAVRASQRIAASQFAKLGMAAVRVAQETAAVQALARVGEPFASLTMRTVDDVAQFAARHSENIEEIISVINRNLENVIPAAVKDFEAQMARRLKGAVEATDEVLASLMKQPVSGTLKLDFIVLEDGRVVQRIRTALYRRPGGRVSNAVQTAKDAGLDTTRGDWGHIVPDVLGGPDEAWNMVVMSERYNRSFYKSIDRLLDVTPELEGLPVMAYVEFESIEAAQTRVASGIVWELPGAGQMDPRFIALGNPLNQPSATFGMFMNDLGKFFRRLKRIAT